MDKNSLPVVGLLLAAVIAFLPAGSSPVQEGDTLDQANDTYREFVAQTIVKYRDREKTKETAEELTQLFADTRKQVYEGPVREIFGLWWNDEEEEAARRLRSHELGLSPVTPIEDD